MYGNNNPYTQSYKKTHTGLFVLFRLRNSSNEQNDTKYQTLKGPTICQKSKLAIPF